MARKETSVERRIKELEKEAESVSHNIRSLAKAARKLDLTAEAATVSQQHREPYRWSVTQTKAVSVEKPAPDESPSWGVETPGAARKRTPMRSEQMASYLSSGSFGKARPLSMERRLQRNKAIVMVLFVIVVAFLLYWAIF